jgi:hypothetical protein
MGRTSTEECKMAENEIAERWAELCRSAESAGAQSLRILEAALLKAMNDCASMEADRNRWVDVAGERALQVEGHRTTIDQLRARLTPPSPKHGLTRAHNLHIKNEAGQLIEVSVDYEIDQETGHIFALYVWLGNVEIMEMLRPWHDLAITKQIQARLDEDAAEMANEQRGIARKERGA